MTHSIERKIAKSIKSSIIVLGIKKRLLNVYWLNSSSKPKLWAKKTSSLLRRDILQISWSKPAWQGGFPFSSQRAIASKVRTSSGSSWIPKPRRRCWIAAKWDQQTCLTRRCRNLLSSTDICRMETSESYIADSSTQTTRSRWAGGAEEEKPSYSESTSRCCGNSYRCEHKIINDDGWQQEQQRREKQCGQEELAVGVSLRFNSIWNFN